MKAKGIVLLSVMWVLLVLAIMAMTGLSTIRLQAQLTANLTREAKFQAIADAGIYQAIQILSEPQIAGQKAMPKTQFSLRFADVDIDIRIENEGNKIDINSAEESLITALLAYHLIGFHDAREIGEKIRNLRFSSTEKVFKTTAQLIVISPLIGQLYHCIKPYITVYSGQSGVDYNRVPSNIKSLLEWADAQRWDDREWIPLRAQHSISAVATGTSVMRTSVSQSGHAFRINASVDLPDSNRLTRTAIIRLSGNRLKPFWLLEIGSSRGANQSHAQDLCKLNGSKKGEGIKSSTENKK